MQSSSKLNRSVAHLKNARKKKGSIAFKMQMMNGDTAQPTTKIQEAKKFKALTATKNIHKKFAEEEMKTITEVNTQFISEKDQLPSPGRKRINQDDVINDEPRKQDKLNQIHKASLQCSPKVAGLEQFEQTSEIGDNEFLKQKKQQMSIAQFDWLNFQHPYKHLIFSGNCTENEFKRHIALVYRGLVYSKKCLKGPSEKYIASKQVKLPNPKVPKTKTLFLDLDETLVHSCTSKENPQKLVTAYTEMGDETVIGLNVRPYCNEFLEMMSQYYEVYIFTASSPSYANAIIKYLDPQERYILGILTRENCMETKNGFFIKDLRIIKNRQLKNIIMVDNLAHSFGFQIDNGVPILEWHNNLQDRELKYIAEYLIMATKEDDMRTYNSVNLKLQALASLNPDQLQL
eukprot:TRINITY_DN7017_c0_g1_i2.p1 TRINITY_DN7017_c0_g1~~TRINITY_DN7017_c0_g1_i2.p1  ORF type:complete len:402 (+),score=43.53 TRINITY_DN7017_c0_g1_i2:146-1351(+)